MPVVHSEHLEPEARPSLARFVAVRTVSVGLVVGVLAVLLAWLAFLVWLSTETITWLWRWL